jgi:FixJ family two-component response regulator
VFRSNPSDIDDQIFVLAMRPGAADVLTPPLKPNKDMHDVINADLQEQWQDTASKRGALSPRSQSSFHRARATGLDVSKMYGCTVMASD